MSMYPGRNMPCDRSTDDDRAPRRRPQDLRASSVVSGDRLICARARSVVVVASGQKGEKDAPRPRPRVVLAGYWPVGHLHIRQQCATACVRALWLCRPARMFCFFFTGFALFCAAFLYIKNATLNSKSMW